MKLQCGVRDLAPVRGVAAMSARQAASRFATTLRGVRECVPWTDRNLDVVRTTTNQCFSKSLHRDVQDDDRRASARAAGPRGFATSSNTSRTHARRHVDMTHTTRHYQRTHVSWFNTHARGATSAKGEDTLDDENGDMQRAIDASKASNVRTGQHSPPTSFTRIAGTLDFKDLPTGTIPIAVVSGVLMAGHACVAPVLPAFSVEFGASAAQVGATLSSFALARLLCNYPFGIVADTYGRKPLLVLGPLITAAGMFGCSFSGTLAELLFHRFVAGAGSAAYASGASATLTDLSTSTTRGRVLGTNQAFALGGAAIGPAIGGALANVTYFGEFATRAPFAAVGGLCLVAAAHAYRKAPETLNVVEGRVIRHTMKTSARVNRHTTHPLSSHVTPSTRETAESNVTSPLDTDTSALDNGANTSKKKSQKQTRVQKARLDFFAASGVNSALFFSGSGGRATLLPLLAASTHGLNVGEIGTLFSAMALTSLIGAWPASLLADLAPRKNVVFGAMSVSTLAVLCTALSPSKETFVVSSIAWAAAHAAMGPAPAAYAADVSGPKINRGVALATYRTCGDVGMLVGPVFLGACADVVGAPAALGVNAAILGTSAVGFKAVASDRDHRVLSRVEKKRSET